MNLDLFNNIINGIKENNFVQNFMKELSNHLEKVSSLKQENCIYQVTEIETDGAYLQNINNNQVAKETDIPKEILDKIQEDTVLIYKNRSYKIEENLTEQFFNSLVDIKEYDAIQRDFIEQNKMSEIASDTNYILKEKTEDYSILTYGDNEKNSLKVPNALIPFWAKTGDNLCYSNGEFKREI